MTVTEKIMTAVAATLTVQVVVGLLWVGAAAHRISDLEGRLSTLSSVEIRAARLEEQTSHLRAAVDRIEGKIDEALRDGGDR